MCLLAPIAMLVAGQNPCKSRALQASRYTNKPRRRKMSMTQRYVFRERDREREAVVQVIITLQVFKP